MSGYHSKFTGTQHGRNHRMKRKSKNNKHYRNNSYSPNKNKYPIKYIYKPKNWNMEPMDLDSPTKYNINNNKNNKNNTNNNNNNKNINNNKYNNNNNNNNNNYYRMYNNNNNNTNNNNNNNKYNRSNYNNHKTNKKLYNNSNNNFKRSINNNNNKNKQFNIKKPFMSLNDEIKHLKNERENIKRLKINKNKQIDQLKKEIEVLNGKLKHNRNKLKKCQEKLRNNGRNSEKNDNISLIELDSDDSSEEDENDNNNDKNNDNNNVNNNNKNNDTKINEYNNKNNNNFIDNNFSNNNNLNNFLINRHSNQIVTDEEIARLLQQEELRETNRYYPSMHFHDRIIGRNEYLNMNSNIINNNNRYYNEINYFIDRPNELDIDNMSYEELLERFPQTTKGAKNSDINSLPIEIYKINKNKNISGNNSCSICLNKFKDGDSIRRLPCLHIFHKEEIDKWLKSNHVCPVCRFPIESNTIN